MKNPVNLPSTPIKVANLKKYCEKVVTGEGVHCCIESVPINHFENIEGNLPTVWYKTLLDSGSDGDLIFVTKEQLKQIPQVKKNVANEWSTSTGKFVTKYIGVLEFMFTAFSRSKVFSVNCDIVIVPKGKKNYLQCYTRHRNPSTIWNDLRFY